MSVSDFFNRQDYGRTISFLDQNSRILNDLDTRYIRLGFRYKFGNTKLSTNERAADEIEEEREKRLEKDH